MAKRIVAKPVQMAILKEQVAVIQAAVAIPKYC
jgi:hypothetical protein